jgi:hypothetical protein
MRSTGSEPTPNPIEPLTYPHPIRHWHITLGRGPWGHGRFGWRPDYRPNVAGGHTLGWWQIQIWTTHDA